MSRDSMDPFEEFQFKPLTEGLGFHRKNQKENLKDRGLNSLDFEDEDPTKSAHQFRARGLDLIDDEKPLDFKSPLSRQRKLASTEDVALSPTSAAVDEILKNLNHKRPREPLTKGQTSHQTQTQAKKTQAKIQSQGKFRTEQVGLEKCGVNLFAGFLDSMLVAAGTLLGFIVLLTVTQVDLLTQLTKPQDYEIYFASFAVFFGVSIVYFLATRIFLGCTPGEWAYDQQLGSKADQSEYSYAFLIIIRTCINLFTGIVLLPLISQIANRDFVGQLIGLELYRKS